MRRGGGRRRRQRSCLTTLYGFNSLELLSREPAGRSTRSATASRSAKARGVRAARAPRPAATRSPRWAAARAATRYHMSTPHPEGAGAAAAMQRALASRAASRPTTSTTSTCTAPRRRPTTRPRTRRCARSFGERVPVQLDQGLDRPRAGRGRHHRSADLRCIALDDGCVPGTLNCRTLDPQIRSRIAAGRRSPARLARAMTQLVRIRRQQLQPRASGRGMSSSRDVVAGVGICASGHAGLASGAQTCSRGRCAWQPRPPLPKLDVPLLPATERRRAEPPRRAGARGRDRRRSPPWPVDRSVVDSRRCSPPPTATARCSQARCRRLADDAAAMSPTRFHNSVLNAPAGYWTHREPVARALDDGVGRRRDRSRRACSRPRSRSPSTERARCCSSRTTCRFPPLARALRVTRRGIRVRACC